MNCQLVHQNPSQALTPAKLLLKLLMHLPVQGQQSLSYGDKITVWLPGCWSGGGNMIQISRTDTPKPATRKNRAHGGDLPFPPHPCCILQPSPSIGVQWVPNLRATPVSCSPNLATIPQKFCPHHASGCQQHAVRKGSYFSQKGSHHHQQTLLEH